MITKELYNQISDVAKTIIHDDEYGYVFYNTKTKQIWWCASDGFESDDSEDTESDIITKFSKINEVKSVVIELEHMPNNEDEDEDDYDENWEEIKYK